MRKLKEDPRARLPPLRQPQVEERIDSLPQPAVRKRRSQSSPQGDRVLKACERLQRDGANLQDRTPPEVKALLREYFEKYKTKGLGTPSRQVMDQMVRLFLSRLSKLSKLSG